MKEAPWAMCFEGVPKYRVYWRTVCLSFNFLGVQHIQCPETSGPFCEGPGAGGLLYTLPHILSGICSLQQIHRKHVRVFSTKRIKHGHFSTTKTNGKKILRKFLDISQPQKRTKISLPQEKNGISPAKRKKCWTFLKGQCHEIFWHFWIEATWAPDKQAKMVLLKFSFSRRNSRKIRLRAVLVQLCAG